MSRKKIVPNYAISLDIGNASVGWAAFTPDYRLMRAKGRELNWCKAIRACADC